ncbi:MAG: hypothetical protein RL701_2342 [Pseudomonadota bacterium]
MTRTCVAGVCVLILAAMSGNCSQAEPEPEQKQDAAVEQLPASCVPAQPATAHSAAVGGAATASSATGSAPTGCAYLTGLGSAENTLAIDRQGHVFMAPVFTDQGVGILRSGDNGASWQAVLPQQTGGAQHGRAQPYLFLDPASDRLLFATSKTTGLGQPNGFDLSISSDGGASWSASTFNVGTLDWVKILSGPPVTSTLQGYPSVLYASAPAPISTPSPLSNPDNQQILRSLDGGATWANVGGKMLSLKPIDHGCTADEWVIYGDGVVDERGSIFLGLRRCTHLGVAISHDEGATWRVQDVPGANIVAYGGLLSHLQLSNLMMTAPFAVDSAGNLYAIWPDANNALQYAVSKDKAQTWSAPVAINAPTAKQVVFGAIVTRAPGTLAVAYYGSDDGQAYRGYIAETQNALDPQPTFWNIVIDDHGAPLFNGGFDIGYAEILSGGDLVEIVQVRYAPNGDLWAAFVKDMCPGSGSTGTCTWDLATHAKSPYQGVIGHVTHH